MDTGNPKFDGIYSVLDTGPSIHGKMLDLYSTFSPLRRNITEAEVGKAAMFLLSDLASGISGETLHVDSGFHCMGAPPLDAFAGKEL